MMSLTASELRSRTLLMSLRLARYSYLFFFKSKLCSTILFAKVWEKEEIEFEFTWGVPRGRCWCLETPTWRQLSSAPLEKE